MNPYSANPLLHEYALLEDLGITPNLLKDQEVQLPSFKDLLKWVFGKPLKILLRRGLEAKKVDLWLAVLDAKRTEQVNKIKQEESELEKMAGRFS
jgi:hypothetical protein